MGFFQNIIDSAKLKSQELKEKRDFRALVDRETMPIRRGAYLEQRKEEAREEGRALARIDSMKIRPQKQKTKEDFGIIKGIEDPYKYMGGSPKKPKQEKSMGGNPKKTKQEKKK